MSFGFLGFHPHIAGHYLFVRTFNFYSSTPGFVSAYFAYDSSGFFFGGRQFIETSVIDECYWNYRNSFNAFDWDINSPGFFWMC